MSPKRDHPRKVADDQGFVFDGLVIDPRDRRFCEEKARQRVSDVGSRLATSREAALPSRSRNPDSDQPQERKSTVGDPNKRKASEQKGTWTTGQKVGGALAFAGLGALVAYGIKKALTRGSQETSPPTDLGYSGPIYRRKDPKVLRALADPTKKVTFINDNLALIENKKPWWKFW